MINQYFAGRSNWKCDHIASWKQKRLCSATGSNSGRGNSRQGTETTLTHHQLNSFRSNSRLHCHSTGVCLWIHGVQRCHGPKCERVLGNCGQVIILGFFSFFFKSLPSAFVKCICAYKLFFNRILSNKVKLGEETTVLHKEPRQKKSSGCCWKDGQNCSSLVQFRPKATEKNVAIILSSSVFVVTQIYPFSNILRIYIPYFRF